MEQAPTYSLSGESSPTVDLTPLGPLLPLTDAVDHGLDVKSRAVLPAAVRPAFLEGGFLTMWVGPCVAAFPATSFTTWVDRIRGQLATSGFDDPAAHVRYVHARSARFRPDLQGRFVLPDRFREAAGIEREVTVVGVGDRVELWDTATYGRDLDELEQNISFLQSTYDLPEVGA